MIHSMPSVPRSCLILMTILWVVVGECVFAQTLEPNPIEPQSENSAVNSMENSAETQNQQPMHWSADYSKLNRKTNIVELRGNAVVSRDNELLKANEIDVNLTTDHAYARGQVRYQYENSLIKAESLTMNMRTKTGVVINGTLTQGQLALQGSEFQVLSSDHFIVKDYHYTTCIDCPNAWSIVGTEADFTFEGYAFMKDFIFRVKDAATFWSPFMVMPIKSRRQSGFLFPRFGVSEVHGNVIVQPYFWAINDWSDMTVGLGHYSRRGTRFEWEGRYMISQRSQGILNFFWTKDPKLTPKITARGGGSMLVTQKLPLGFEVKLKWFEISDSGYLIEFAEDMPGRYEPVLTSDLFFSKNDPSFSAAVSFRRIRNLLYFDDQNNFTSGFDPKTVQELPRILLNTNNQLLFGSKIAAGVEARYNRFIRSAGSVDTLNINGVPTETIREANRLTLIPNLYTTLNPFPWLSFVPSVQYRSFFYNFNNVYPDLSRGYLLAQAEASVQFERVFQNEDQSKSYKHTIRPAVQYSVIPMVQQSSDHPFMRSAQNSGRTGQFFDNWDIVPLGTSQNLDTYFTPLGHSISYGFISQLFRKVKPTIDPDEERLKNKKKGRHSLLKKEEPILPIPAWRLAEFSVLQTLDIRESQKGGIPLSPLFANFLLAEQDVTWNTEYTYFYALERYREAQLKSFSSPHRVSTSLKWYIERASAGNTLTYERSVGMTYSFSKLSSKVSSLRTDLLFSINDYLMPSASFSYDLTSTSNKLLESKYGILYQSPSRCWRIDAAMTRSIDRGVGISFSFGLNLSGNGITGYDDSLQNI
jgi:lipopolysaccharide assembly outer membrane protein LptD (OstA)